MTPRKPFAGFWITLALVAVLVGYPLAAKVASHPWSIDELYERVMATVEA